MKRGGLLEKKGEPGSGGELNRQVVWNELFIRCCSKAAACWDWIVGPAKGLLGCWAGAYAGGTVRVKCRTAQKSQRRAGLQTRGLRNEGHARPGVGKSGGAAGRRLRGKSVQLILACQVLGREGGRGGGGRIKCWSGSKCVGKRIKWGCVLSVAGRPGWGEWYAHGCVEGWLCCVRKHAASRCMEHQHGVHNAISTAYGSSETGRRVRRDALHGLPSREVGEAWTAWGGLLGYENAGWLARV